MSFIVISVKQKTNFRVNPYDPSLSRKRCSSVRWFRPFVCLQFLLWVRNPRAIYRSAISKTAVAWRLQPLFFTCHYSWLFYLHFYAGILSHRSGKSTCFETKRPATPGVRFVGFREAPQLLGWNVGGTELGFGLR